MMLTNTNEMTNSEEPEPSDSESEFSPAEDITGGKVEEAEAEEKAGGGVAADGESCWGRGEIRRFEVAVRER